VKKFEKFNTPSQIKLIHVAKGQLGIKDEQYREILSGFVLANGETATSSKQLSYDQCEALIHIFVKLGFKTGRKEFEEFENRGGSFATPGQMRLIKGTWMNSPNTREKSVEAMNNFIKVITGKSHITFLKANEVSKVLKAIGSLR